MTMLNPCWNGSDDELVGSGQMKTWLPNPPTLLTVSPGARFSQGFTPQPLLLDELLEGCVSALLAGCAVELVGPFVEEIGCTADEMGALEEETGCDAEDVDCSAEETGAVAEEVVVDTELVT